MVDAKLCQSQLSVLLTRVGLGMGGRINFYSIRWHEHGGAWFRGANVRRRMSALTPLSVICR